MDGEWIESWWWVVIAVDATVGTIIGAWRARALAGAIFGALLGPVGWLLVALGPNRAAPHAEACPYCLQAVPTSQQTCARCKNRLVWIHGKPRKPAGQAAKISQ